MSLTFPKESVRRLHEVHLGEEYRHDYRRFTVQNGDLLLSVWQLFRGKVAEFKSDGIPTILNTSTIRVNELRPGR